MPTAAETAGCLKPLGASGRSHAAQRRRRTDADAGLIDDGDTHVLGCPLNHGNDRFDLGGVGVGQLGLGNLCNLGAGDLANLVLVGLARTALNA